MEVFMARAHKQRILIAVIALCLAAIVIYAIIKYFLTACTSPTYFLNNVIIYDGARTKFMHRDPFKSQTYFYNNVFYNKSTTTTTTWHDTARYQSNLGEVTFSKISESPTAEKYTLGQRAADAIAKFAGSWAFIFAFTGVLILWMVINTILAAKAFDPYPFILLNLVLSCVAAIQAPLIMMSQNRQEEKDRRRAENDYKVNLKTEIMIEDLYDKVNAILAKQSALEKKLQEQEETKS